MVELLIGLFNADHLEHASRRAKVLWGFVFGVLCVACSVGGAAFWYWLSVR